MKFVPLHHSSSLNAHTIQKFYNLLNRGSEDKPALSSKTVKNIHGVLHKALQQAVLLGYIRFNPSESCTLPRIERRELKPLEDEKIGEFLEAIAGNKYETLYLIDLFIGLRQGEILGLTWDCVDFNNGTLFIYQQLQKEKKKGGKYYLAPLKNDKSRRLTVAPTVLEALQQQYRKQLSDRMTAGCLWQPGELQNLVFTDEFGKHLSHFTVWKHFHRIVASIGMPETRFHDLRHSYAVAAIQTGDDIKTVQENLDHATASFTLDVYGHVSERMKQDSAERMEKFIKEVTG